jgi:S1-C subfamily serine protease
MIGLNEPFEPLAARIARLCDVLFGHNHANNRVSLEHVATALPGESLEALRYSLRKLNTKEIVYFDGQNAVELYPRGRYLHSAGCVSEFVLGFDYIAEKYRTAVVRVIVRKPNGAPAAGSGFFVSDPPNHIITNRHVAENEITRIEDFNHNVVHDGDSPRILGEDNQLDLAAIQCEKPENVAPLRIAWERNSVWPMAEVLVLGYPIVGGHHPGLHHGRGRIGQLATQFGGRESIILTELTDAGGSGGPVINIEGMVVGVVSGQRITQTEGQPPTIFVNAIPAHYLREVVPP